MKNIYLGFIFLAYSLFLFLFSPKEPGNLFGYKSPQLNTHRRIWEWSNTCFGLLVLIGSCFYLIISIFLEGQGISLSMKLNKGALIYLAFSFAVTELYVFMRKRMNR